MTPLAGWGLQVARGAALLVALAFQGEPAPVPAPSSAAVPAPSAAAPARRDEAAVLSRLDWLYQRRDDAGTFAEAHRLAAAAVAASPSSYEALWRAARETFAETDQPNRSEDERWRRIVRPRPARSSTASPRRRSGATTPRRSGR